MKTTDPFVLSYARTQVASSAEATRYDDETDELLILRDGKWVPAIDADTGPRTKKADLETGEDQKDRW